MNSEHGVFKKPVIHVTIRLPGVTLVASIPLTFGVVGENSVLTLEKT
jgi:hypothetical protein